MSDQKERFKLIAEVYLLLLKDNQILLLQRANTGYEDGKYSLIAGHVDANESITSAMTREAKEESGINIDPGDLSLKLAMHRRTTDRDQVGFFFTTAKYIDEPRNTEPHKCSDMKWFGLDHLPENTIPYIKKAIECFKEGINYCEFGW